MSTKASSTIENHAEQHGPDPRARPEPGSLAVGGLGTDVEHHDDEHEEHHDGPGVDDDDQGRNQRRPENEEHDARSQQRTDEVQQSVHGIRSA